MSVRRLTREDVPGWREVRLRMLAEEPENFLASHADWVDRPLADWEDFVGRNIFVSWFEDGRQVGTMGLRPQTARATRHRAVLIAVWLDPEWRGSGRAEAMLEAIVGVARGEGVLQIELEVAEGNDRARRFYERCGFVAVGPIPRAVRTEAGEFRDDLRMVRMLDA